MKGGRLGNFVIRWRKKRLCSSAAETAEPATACRVRNKCNPQNQSSDIRHKQPQTSPVVVDFSDKNGRGMKSVLEAFTGLFLIQAQPDAQGMWSYRRLPYCSTGRPERSQVFQESNSDHSNNCDPASFHTFMQYLDSSSLSANTQTSILSDLKQIGFTNSDQLLEFSRDFVERPESLSTVLQTDFGLSALRSHQLRSTLMRMVKDSTLELQKRELIHSVHSVSDSSTSKSIQSSTPLVLPTSVATDADGINSKRGDDAPRLFKAVVVNKKAKRRHEQLMSKDEEDDHLHQSRQGHRYNYGINHDCPLLAQELQDFMLYMTQPQTNSQEPPIRKSTAQVYIRHAKLFIGWWVHQHRKGGSMNEEDLSLRQVFPNSEASSAQPIVSFILWLRQERNVSHSYEANMLRGLTKMMKFRFVKESQADPSYGEKTFQDIPIIRELRKLHREANKKQALSPRSSDEGMKWITWLEYLKVVQALKDDLTQEIQLWTEGIQDKKNTETSKRVTTPTQRRIATKYQYYLIVAIFSCVPDRQRTVRELELGRTLHRDDTLGCWVIKHGPDDYKTGGTYGDRPPLVLASELTSPMDDFLQNWREYLNPTGSHFFAQTRTGQPLTQDSVYSIVARSCFKYTGKKTNPHLLRDMIVTHIRNSEASEKELEALALYMGHSISMQRTSYDRRTMQQKVAPAIELLRSVNHAGGRRSSHEKENVNQ